jgi:hypothetical protein
MSRDVILLINGKVQNFPKSQLVQIKEVDCLQLRVRAEKPQHPRYALFGDLRTDFFPDPLNPGWWEIYARTYFSESCGHGELVIKYSDDEDVSNDIDQINFDIFASKTTAEQARKMISYLAARHEDLIAACLSRTTHRAGALQKGAAHPEMLLSAAERFLVLVQERRIELINDMRERLIPKRVPLWDGRIGANLDPTDVLSNLDALVPSSGNGDVIVRGRHYTLSNIQVTELHATRDVAENRILLGGLYSIRRRIMGLQDELLAYDQGQGLGELAGYESLRRLVLTLTAGAMLRRASAVLWQAATLIRLFEQQFKISFVGELAPIMTAYARSRRTYRELYGELAQWYSLGAPSLGTISFLMKLRSLSRIFELYVLFHIIDALTKMGWVGESMRPHPEFGEHVPLSISLAQGDECLSLEYEPKILPPNSLVNHMDLVDMKHKRGGQWAYWTPDYVLRLTRRNAVRYVIMDAKYSPRSTVQTYSLPAIHEKYYLNTSVFDASMQMYSSHPIIGVFAVYALPSAGRGHLEYWPQHGLYSVIPRLPVIGGIGLVVDDDLEFEDAIVAAVSMARHHMPRDA